MPEAEITKAAKSLKNGKSCGIDDLNAEYIKYAPPAVHQEIANILNETAENTRYPDRAKNGHPNTATQTGKKERPTGKPQAHHIALNPQKNLNDLPS